MGQICTLNINDNYMKKILVVISAILMGCNAKSEIKNETIKALIGKVDDIKLPISSSLIHKIDGEGGVGDYNLKLNKSGTDNLDELKAGYSAYLVGDVKNPKAVIFDIKSNLGVYLVPFKGVRELDRPRTILKMEERFYKILSNRSSDGSYTKTLK